MTPAEAQIVLSSARALDGGSSPATAEGAELEAGMWARALAGVQLPEALAAVVAHYRGSSRRVMPNDVLELVRMARRASQSLTRSRLAQERDAWLSARGISPAEYAAGSPSALAAARRAAAEDTGDELRGPGRAEQIEGVKSAPVASRGSENVR